ATAVVIDVNVYLDYILGDDGSWPLMPDVPPTTNNPAADAVSLAFASRFRLFASPHILHNVVRVMRTVDQQETTVESFATAITEMCEFSGGGVIEPESRDLGICDYEDSLTASLAMDSAFFARIFVTTDHDLLTHGPACHGRLIMRPREFVRNAFTRFR